MSVALILIPLIVVSLVTIIQSMRLTEASYQNYKVYTMRKIGASMETIFDELNSVSLQLISNPNVQAYLSQESDKDDDQNRYDPLLRSIQNELFYLASITKYSQSIHLYGNNGKNVYTGSFSPNLSEEEYKRVNGLQGKPSWAFEELTTVDGAAKRYLYQSRLLRNPGDGLRPTGVLKIYIDDEQFQRFFKNEEDPYTEYYVVDPSGIIQVSTVEGLEDTKMGNGLNYELMRQHDGSSFKVKMEDGSYYAAPYLIPKLNWIVYSLSSTEAIDDQARTSLVTFITLALVCFIFCCLLAYFFSRSMLAPLKQLVKLIMSVEKENFSVRFLVKGKDEISILARQFNRMVEKIESLINQVYLITISRKEAELRALREQINPHFLYNTLDSIYWSAKMENANQTSGMIKSLSDLFRLSLESKGDFSTVRTEVEHIKNYIVLLQQRTDVPFAFDLELEPGSENCKVVKLVLQPLIENALKHGISNLEDGMIHIRIRRDDDNLVYFITDNGKGFDPDKMYRLLKHTEKDNHGLGIKNVNDRIRLAFGEAYGLTFITSETETIVKVVQPWIEEDET